MLFIVFLIVSSTHYDNEQTMDMDGSPPDHPDDLPLVEA